MTTKDQKKENQKSTNIQQSVGLPEVRQPINNLPLVLEYLKRREKESNKTIIVQS